MNIKGMLLFIYILCTSILPTYQQKLVDYLPQTISQAVSRCSEESNVIGIPTFSAVLSSKFSQRLEQFRKQKFTLKPIFLLNYTGMPSTEQRTESGMPINLTKTRSSDPKCVSFNKNGKFKEEDCLQTQYFLCEEFANATSNKQCSNLYIEPNAQQRNWIDAREECRKRNRSLIEIISVEMEQIVENYLKSRNIYSIWTGVSNIIWQEVIDDKDLKNKLCVVYSEQKQIFELFKCTTSFLHLTLKPIELVCQESNFSVEDVKEPNYNSRLKLCERTIEKETSSTEESTIKLVITTTSNEKKTSSSATLIIAILTSILVIVVIVFIALFIVLFRRFRKKNYENNIYVNDINRQDINGNSKRIFGEFDQDRKYANINLDSPSKVNDPSKKESVSETSDTEGKKNYGEKEDKDKDGKRMVETPKSEIVNENGREKKKRKKIVKPTKTESKTTGGYEEVSLHNEKKTPAKNSGYEEVNEKQYSKETDKNKLKLDRDDMTNRLIPSAPIDDSIEMTKKQATSSEYEEVGLENPSPETKEKKGIIKDRGGYEEIGNKSVSPKKNGIKKVARNKKRKEAEDKSNDNTKKLNITKNKLNKESLYNNSDVIRRKNKKKPESPD
ncbi:DgyrCDS12759 [Dimorphilus gyrociliatus]|uniref:DgyrCDS12759 n=1 Tax=Dimorphilus gyrociliatus TaxID=2664684 RepID=A0A7I8W803_9ANNE|nr:DgyrCDS12759 [Dimorphilus gyrociliatus]